MCTVTTGGIVDGDTFLCREGQNVRLRGVDAFELKEPKGKEAKEYLRHLLETPPETDAFKGRASLVATLLCRIEQAEPTGGRVVATCYLPNTDIAELLVDMGLARGCRAFGGEYYDGIEPEPLTGPDWCEGKRAPVPATKPRRLP